MGCVNCIPTYPNSITCDNVKPLTCIPNFFVSASNVCTSCANLAGFNVVNGQCIEICGDGINYVMGCDDGNNLNGDGCSSTCTVENNWVCTNVNPNTPSVCKITSDLKMTLISSKKVVGANEIEMVV